MNAGAKKAKGDILLFLHADTQLPKDWDVLVKKASEKCKAGAFTKRFDKITFWIKMNEVYTNIKAKLLGDYLGDNAMWIKKALFRSMGGVCKGSYLRRCRVIKETKKSKD